jgi:hypothetical protein
MCRTYEFGGIALAILSLCLLAYGNWSGNKLCINYWFYQNDFEKQLIKGIPLTFYGLINSFIFNLFCLMALCAHIRATFADPGYIPEDVEIPDYIDTSNLKSCDKCDMRWKP